MTRAFRISWIALALGMAVGMALGLVYAWVLAPVVEFDTQPWQLDEDSTTHYLAAISLAYRADGDLRRAVERLVELRLPGDPFAVLAETACDLFRQGVDTINERNTIEAMIALYRPQGRTGCADESALFAVAETTATPFPTPVPVTPSPPPPASKTPTPNSPLSVTPPTLAPTRTPSPPPQADDFSVGPIQTFCSVEAPGVIEVFVRRLGVEGIPGVAVQVRWEGGADTFFTGLKPERDPGYADFQMAANRTYTVEIPGRSPRSTDLTASQCTTEDGQRATTSYRVFFVLQ